MNSSNPLHNASHVIPVSALSLLLLSAGMCQQAEENQPEETGGPIAVVETFEPASDELAETGPTAAEIEEQERQAALAEAEQELAEREARLAAEEERLQRERQLQADRERLAAERAEAAERERQLATRERELREQEERLARLEEELAAEKAITVEPAAPKPTYTEPTYPATTNPEPLPEPTGNYEGNFDESWRESQDTAETDPETLPSHTDEGFGASGELEPVLPQPARTSVQAGERLEVQILQGLSSETAREGDVISTHLVQDLRDAAGTVVISAGAEVIGRVTESTPFRRGGGPATLGVEFTDIVISPEQTVGIRASFVELGANRKKNRKKVVAGAIVGAILGHILGGDGSSNVIVGAAAGAAAGGAMVASSNRGNAEIPAGQIIALQLEEVVTVEIAYGTVAGQQ